MARVLEANWSDQLKHNVVFLERADHLVGCQTTILRPPFSRGGSSRQEGTKPMPNVLYAATDQGYCVPVLHS